MISLPDILSVTLRAISFVLLFQAAGVAIFRAGFGARLEVSDRGICRLGAVAAIAAIVFTAAYYLLEAARMSGDLTGVFDTSLQRLVMVSSSGAALVCRLVGLAMIALALAPERTYVALCGVGLTVVSFALTGHTADHSQRFVLAAMLLTHIAIGVFWFGSLLPLCLVAQREPRERAGRVVESFSRTATWLVPLIAIAGLVMTAVLIPGWATLTEPYGQLLIVKSVLFTILMGLAAANKLRFGPALTAGEPGAVQGFRRVVVAEFVLICLVLAVTACLTEFFSPE